MRARGRAISTRAVAMIVLGVFVGATGAAMGIGHWRNRISPAEYLQRFTRLDSPMVQHARGHVPAYGPND